MPIPILDIASLSGPIEKINIKIETKKKIIFVHNPKAAGSTIHVALKDLYNFKPGSPERKDPEPHIHHSSYQQILDMKEDLIIQY